jgi:hypothetical protein
MSKHSRGLAARTLGVLSVILAVVLTTGSGAYAASKTVRDASGDTYASTGDEKPVRTTGPVADILSVTTSHRAKVVVVRIRVRALASAMNIGILEVKTSNPGRPYLLTGVATDNVKVVSLTKGLTGDNEVSCHGVRMAFKPAQHTVLAQIPRTCLGNPRWVRTGALLMSSDDASGLASDSFGGSVDVAGLDAISDSFWNDDAANLPLGPKVRRG